MDDVGFGFALGVFSLLWLRANLYGLQILARAMARNNHLRRGRRRRPKVKPVGPVYTMRVVRGTYYLVPESLMEQRQEDSDAES